MFQINSNSNEIVQLVPKSFSELGFTERGHLQEWIAKMPESLGGELLIIRKEFDGFDKTRERLDLLALDKQGDLVVIENKLDDSGRDVVWQALKYASYCSSLSKSHRLLRFIRLIWIDPAKRRMPRNASWNFWEPVILMKSLMNEGVAQRLIFVAANFRRGHFNGHVAIGKPNPASVL